MRRFVFTSDEFSDFESAAPDDHVKIAFPHPDDPSLEPVRRDFTPRSFDKNSLTVDFVLHESGPATQWASNAKTGDQIAIGGPRGSRVVPDDFDWYVFIGDETAIPAIGRWVEQLRPGVPVATFMVTPGADERHTFHTAADYRPIWIVRSPLVDDASAFKDALANYVAPGGDGFVWIAAEAMVARTLREYFVSDRQHPKAWVKASGYWKRGVADSHETIED